MEESFVLRKGTIGGALGLPSDLTRRDSWHFLQLVLFFNRYIVCSVLNRFASELPTLSFLIFALEIFVGKHSKAKKKQNRQDDEGIILW